MSLVGHSRRFDDVPVTSALPLVTDLRRKYRHVRNVPTTEVAFSLDHLVGEREKRRRNREESAVLWGVLTGSLRGWSADSSASRAKKNVFRPMGWGKLAISFCCDGLVRERLDRRRTANVAADVAAAIASG